jgi:hypothetical protein
MATLIVVEDLAAPSVIGRGGHAMYVLQWLHALKRLGHDVLFVEFLDEPPSAQAIAYFNDVIGGWWSHESAALIVEDSGASLAGLDVDAVARAAHQASGVITLAAHYRRSPWPLLQDVRPRVLVDTDPGYTHLWAAAGDPLAIFGEHDVFFTVGGNVGSSRSALPTLGLTWHSIWNPVLLDWWSADDAMGRDRLTTIAAWRDYGYLEFQGQVLGPKAEEFRKFIDLPARAGEPLELTLSIDADDPDRALLEGRGWGLESPAAVATPARYRDYVVGSRGEFSCAKGGYVGTHSGWFSDRSACYLAAGRPVVLQATGFEDLLPTGRGLFAVSDVEEAAHAIRTIRADYPRQSAAARSIAAAHFSGDRVAARLLDTAGIPAA